MGEVPDEADRYIASLLEGTEYAKQKDHEARLRMVARLYAIPVKLLCRTSPIPDGATTASKPTPGDASKSEAHQQSADTIQPGAR
jgi:hypothetical protein